MKRRSIEKSFTRKKLLKIGFQNFHVSWNAIKSISRTFYGSLHDEINANLFTISLWHKQSQVYFLFEKSLKMAAIITISTLLPLIRARNLFFFSSNFTFRSWSGKSVNLLSQYQTHKNSDRFNCWLEIQSKIAARISICTLSSLKLT